VRCGAVGGRAQQQLAVVAGERAGIGGVAQRVIGDERGRLGRGAPGAPADALRGDDSALAQACDVVAWARQAALRKRATRDGAQQLA